MEWRKRWHEHAKRLADEYQDSSFNAWPGTAAIVTILSGVVLGAALWLLGWLFPSNDVGSAARMVERRGRDPRVSVRSAGSGLAGLPSTLAVVGGFNVHTAVAARLELCVRMGVMAEIVVEIHVPLLAFPGLAESDYQYPWIDDVEELLGDLEDEGDVTVFDDGEQIDDTFIFFVSGANEDRLLSVASRIATLERVPGGVFAVVTDDESKEIGLGRRVNIVAWSPTGPGHSSSIGPSGGVVCGIGCGHGERGLCLGEHAG